MQQPKHNILFFHNLFGVIAGFLLLFYDKWCNCKNSYRKSSIKPPSSGRGGLIYFKAIWGGA